MTWTVVSDVYELVERIFQRHVPVVDAIEAMMALDEQLTQLAQEKKYWVINKALVKLAKSLLSDVTPELLQALAQRIPLEPESIFAHMGSHPAFPEVDKALVENLLRHERLVDESSELDYCLRKMVEDGGMEQHVITILDEVVRRGNQWSFWREPVAEVLQAAIDRRDVYPKDDDLLREWFIQNETRIQEIDDSYNLCSRWSFKDSVRLYEWGPTELGKIAMDNSGHRAHSFEFLRHAELMDQQATERSYYSLDARPKLCFILATPQPIAPWMMEGLDFQCLPHCFDEAKTRQRVFDQERVTFLVLEASLTLGSFDAFQVIRKLNEHSYPQSKDTLALFFSNVAKRHLHDPMSFCRIFAKAREDKVDLDLTDYSEWPMATLMEKAGQLTQENVVDLLRHYSIGMNLPRLVVEAAVDHSYDSWSEAKQNEVRRLAPDWLLSHSERLREDKLFNDMGL